MPSSTINVVRVTEAAGRAATPRVYGEGFIPGRLDRPIESDDLRALAEPQRSEYEPGSWGFFAEMRREESGGPVWVRGLITMGPGFVEGEVVKLAWSSGFADVAIMSINVVHNDAGLLVFRAETGPA